MSVHKLIKFYCIASFLTVVLPSSIHSDPADFFPSVPIHEDDRLHGEYELRTRGCSFQITEYTPSRLAPRRITRTVFEISYYDTGIDRVNAPFQDAPLSSRHTLVWFANDVSNDDLVDVKIPLRDARLSFVERRNINSVAAKDKQARLTELLTKIKTGNFGTFAAQNHAVSYKVVGSKHEVVAVMVGRTFQLPVERDDAQHLIMGMNSYRLENCSND